MRVTSHRPTWRVTASATHATCEPGLNGRGLAWCAMGHRLAIDGRARPMYLPAFNLTITKMYEIAVNPPEPGTR